MLNLKDISICTPKQGSILTYWLGGAGFLFKFNNGKTICVDPYLSDSVERLFGFKRLMTAPITSEALKFDLLLISHEHADHLDVDSFETLMKRNPAAKVVLPQSCEGYVSKYTKNYTVTAPGSKYDFMGIVIETVKADHGDLSPDAVGFVICLGGRKLYFTGDTALNHIIMDYVIDLRPEIIIPCINGAYGNMNEEEAAILVTECRADVAIPMHFGLFKEHGGSAELFKEKLVENSSEIKCLILYPGQGAEI